MKNPVVGDLIREKFSKILYLVVFVDRSYHNAKVYKLLFHRSNKCETINWSNNDGDDLDYYYEFVS